LVRGYPPPTPPSRATATPKPSWSRWRVAIPLGGKMLSPEQIARTAVFLASEDANAITGQVLHVNGGSYMP
jgi:NAD(P)-dependent dehydrogenase (short-subunit alcohol dehydrogenase family)